MLTKQKLKGIFLSIIIGDTLGTPLNGLSKRHIKSVFKEIVSYIDPLPALKGKINNWRKPGLYSSISQMMILLNYTCLIPNKPYRENFSRSIFDALNNCEYQWGIFRHPDSMEKNLLESLKGGMTPLKPEIFSKSCTRITPVVLPAALNINNSNPLLLDILHLSILFNKEVNSLGGTIFFGYFIKNIIQKQDIRNLDPLIESINATEILIKDIDMYTDEISSFFCDTVEIKNTVLYLLNLMLDLKKIDTLEIAEKVIYNRLNEISKNQVTRATVNHPLLLIPYSIFLSKMHIAEPDNAIFSSLMEGGATSLLCSLTGLILGAVYGDKWIPENLLQGIVNRKRLLNAIENIIDGKVTKSIIDDFIKSESSLTSKEYEEYNARIRHFKPKQKNKKTRKEQEIDLTTHVIESWTKTDKAKWKKERKKFDKYNNS